MHPLAPLAAPPADPNYELLRRNGWAVNTFSGPYCVAWRGRDEVVFRWDADGWHRVGGQGGGGDI